MDASSGCVGFFDRCVSGGGQHPTYKRVRYSAPKNECCLNSASTINNKTCDPKFRAGPNSSDCDDVFQNYCDSLDKLKNDDKCKSWSVKNSQSYNNKVRQYCANNLSDQFCQDKAREIGGMDSAVNTFCASHENDPFCSCYNSIKSYNNSPENIKPRLIALSRPQCYVADCASGSGYQYENMRNSGACPSINVCINDLKVINSERLKLDNINMACDQNQTQSDQQTSEESNSVQNFSLDTLNTLDIMDIMGSDIFLVFIAIFALVILMSILIRKKKSFISNKEKSRNN